MPVTDQELREALGDGLAAPPSLALPGLVADGRTRPAAGDGCCSRISRAPAIFTRPRLAPDPRREIAVYRDVLAPLAVDGTARGRGGRRDAPGVARAGARRRDSALADRRARDVAGGRALARAAARAARPDRRGAAALRRDPPGAALRLAPGTERFAAQVAERLAALPARLIHGDFYPANILVEGDRTDPRRRLGDLRRRPRGARSRRPRLRPLERARTRADRRRVPRRMPRVAPAEPATTCSTRGYCSQPSGSAGTTRWRPPPEQRHDWQAELAELSERLGL